MPQGAGIELRKPLGSGLGGFGPVNGLEFASHRLSGLDAAIAEMNKICGVAQIEFRLLAQVLSNLLVDLLKSLERNH